ncbi:MAG: LuxR family transcriptional regulator [Ilumatobacteraceae bacterium]|nr:LuxR family transcriptional regulator [Ilumatobacteraceae bacterium]
MFRGRSAAIEALTHLLSDAAAGHGRAILVEGVAGVGKTALIDEAVRNADAAGFEVRRTAADPNESTLPFAALAALFGPELRDDRLTADTPALAAAFGRSVSAQPPMVAAVAADAIQVLSAQSTHQPLLVVLDDAQWADPSSVAVLTSVATHLLAERVAVVIARRIGDTEAEDRRADRLLARLPLLAVEPLAHAEAAEWLVVAGFDTASADRWALMSGGLPLALAEIARGGPRQSTERRAVEKLLPEMFRAQLAELPGGVADALVFAVLCPDLGVLRALGRPDITAAVDRACDLGIAGVEPWSNGLRITFRHPLLRAAVLTRSSAVDERAAHAALALAHEQLGLHDQAAVHHSHAADGPDDTAAAAMRAFAERALARGALPEAASAFMSSARLVEHVHDRSALLVRAGDALYDSGDWLAGLQLLDRALDTAADAPAAADARMLRARMLIWMRSPQEAVRELVAAADAMAGVDPHRRSNALASASTLGYLAGDIHSALDWGREAEDVATDAGDLGAAVAASGALSWNLFLCGEWAEYDDRIRDLEPLMRALLDGRTWDGIHLAELFGLTWVCNERWDEAEALIREVLHLVRWMGVPLTVASTTFALGSLCWRRGRWEEAWAIERPLIDDDDTPPLTLAFARTLVAQLASSMGRVEETRSLVAAALPVASAAGAPLTVITGYAALGHLELSLGNDELALTHLDRVAALADDIGLIEPEYLPWAGDHLEALLRSGRTDEAVSRLDALEALAVRGSRRWLSGVVARVRAQTSTDPARRAELFAEAHAHFEAIGWPFEIARTHLAAGSAADRADARRIFLRLGATEWARQAADAGDRHDDTPPSPGVLDLLTPSERAVALAVVSGRSNRQIASELYLSVKTVDHYLQRSYRKVGVRNRVELASTIARGIAAP